jgi:predicted nuclease of predicted toxin-antitoxin system
VFLIDNNLPPTLCAWLADYGLRAQHVRSLGLATRTDTEVWTYATGCGLAIVTKDRDFDRFALQSSSLFCPVFRLKIGNATNENLFAWLGPRISILEAFHSNPNRPEPWPPVIVIE